MANYKRHAAALLLALAVAGGAAGCGAPSASTEAPTQDAPVSETTQPPAWTAWDPVAVTTNAAGERCFALSAQTFLQRYNTLWAADWGEDLLPALDQWTDYGVGTLSRNGGLEGRQYQTRQDPTNFAEPFLALCLTQTGDQVMEVVAGLDQKHYVQGPETLFQRKALYSLRVFFPELTEADFQTLYAQLSQDAQYAETWETPLPARVFYQEGVACYLLLQIGEYDQLHVRAADQALLDQWQAAGVEIIQGFPTADGSAAGEKGDHTT